MVLYLGNHRQVLFPKGLRARIVTLGKREVSQHQHREPNLSSGTQCCEKQGPRSWIYASRSEFVTTNTEQFVFLHKLRGAAHLSRSAASMLILRRCRVTALSLGFGRHMPVTDQCGARTAAV
jgi:hypothetical protein